MIGRRNPENLSASRRSKTVSPQAHKRGIMDSKIERKGKRVIMTLTFETKKEARADYAEKIAAGNEVYVASGPKGLHHVLVDDAALSRLQTPPPRPRQQTANEADRQQVRRRILHPGTRAN